MSGESAVCSKAWLVAILAGAALAAPAVAQERAAKFVSGGIGEEERARARQ